MKENRIKKQPEVTPINPKSSLIPNRLIELPFGSVARLWLLIAKLPN
jgi:hypothetical protein